MKKERITSIILITVTSLVIAWDIYVAVVASNATVSSVLQTMSLKCVTLPFSLGFILGHLFWAREKVLFGISRKYGIVISLALVLPLLVLLDYFYDPGNLVYIYPLIGYLMGHFFWPQKPKLQSAKSTSKVPLEKKENSYKNEGPWA